MVNTRLGKKGAEVTLGNRLRVVRERHGLTLVQVAEVLHIPTEQLAALEEDDVRAFRAEIYARGAYVAYARYLGVPHLADSAVLGKIMSEAREFVSLTVPRPRVWWEQWLTPRWLFVGLLMVSSLVGGSYVVWQVQSFLRLPELRLSEPREVIHTEPQVTIRGWAEPGASVQVNGEPVWLAEDGSFVMELALRSGVNTIAIEAINAAGRSRVIQKDLLVPRS